MKKPSKHIVTGMSPHNAKIMEVRRRTLTSIQDCRKILQESDWDVEVACLAIARASHDEKHGPESHDSYGIVCPYIHSFGRLGVMVELTCESSYTAKHRDFIRLANTIAMHIAWSNPKGIDRNDINPVFGDVCLMDQPEMKETKGQRTIRELISEMSMKTGEKINIRRFARFEVGK